MEGDTEERRRHDSIKGIARRKELHRGSSYFHQGKENIQESSRDEKPTSETRTGSSRSTC